MKVMVLAGGFDQIKLIEKLKIKGCSTILIDYLENPPAKKYANIHHQVSTLDIESVLSIAQNEKIDCVVTACTDQALNTMAIISEKLNLPCYLTRDQAIKLTNKNKMKKIFIENNIKTSNYYELDHLKDIECMFKFPLVIKPANCNSSKGVIKLYDKKELEEMFSIVKSYSRTGEVIIEEFIEGIEISIDAFVQDGISKVLLVTQTNKIKSENKFTIVGSLYPVPAMNPLIEKKIMEVIESIAKAFYLVNSPLLVQAIIKDNEIYVIECSARMGGGNKCELIHKVTSVDIMEAFVRMVFNKKFDIDKTEQYSNALVEYRYCKVGTIRDFYGFNQLKQENLISELFYYKNLNVQMLSAETSSDRAIGYLILGNSNEDIIQKRREINNRVAILGDKDENILLAIGDE